jgi:hypothetical protein
VIAREVDVEALFGERRRRLAVLVGANGVVELAVVEDRAATMPPKRAGRFLTTNNTGNQRSLDCDDSAVVLPGR